MSKKRLYPDDQFAVKRAVEATMLGGEWKDEATESLKRTLERADAALALLAEYERWEASLVEDREVWETRDGLPYMRQDHYDRLIELQEKRNALLHPKG